jgi:hypothetical protein
MAQVSVHVTPDWLDYLAAFSGVGSLALAVVAAAVALWSRGDARRSAEAAEQTARAAARTAELTQEIEARSADQLQIMREEHAAFMEQQRRRPELVPIFEFAGQPNPDAPTEILVRCGAVNVGSATAEKVLVSIMVPQGVEVDLAEADGLPVARLSLVPQLESIYRDGAEYPALAGSWSSDVIPTVRILQHCLLAFPGPGVYEIVSYCNHHELPGGSIRAAARLDLRGSVIHWGQV